MAARIIRGLAAFLSLLAIFATTAPAAELVDKIQLATRELPLSVEHPDEELPWAHAVVALVKNALPALEKASGVPWPQEVLKIKFAADGAETRDLDADLNGEGVLLVRKTGKRKGFRGHQVMSALGRAMGEKVADERWLAEGLGYVYTYYALKERPAIYHYRTYLFELLDDAKHAKRAGLDKWEPAKVEGVTADTELALVAMYLYGVFRTAGEDLVPTVSKKLAEGGPKGVEELVKALDEAAGKPCAPLFYGWAAAAPEGEKPGFKKGAFSDDDDDMLLTFEEEQSGTDPKKPDTDGDLRLDGDEIFDEKSDPLKKDAPFQVTLDGDRSEWARLKKFRQQDADNEKIKAKFKHVRGADLIAYDVCADKEYIYFAIEAEAYDNPLVMYFVQLKDPKETGGAFDYRFAFKGDGDHFFADLRGDEGALSWAEYKNDRRTGVLIKGNMAEMRIPLQAMKLGQSFQVLVYTTMREGEKQSYADSCLKETLTFDKLRK